LTEVFKNKKRFIALFFKLLLLGSPKYYGAKSLKTGGPFFIVGDSCDGKFISLIGQIKIVPMMKKYELES
jgi:hypothetical protein